MALQETGVRLVAENATQFNRLLNNAGKSVDDFGRESESASKGVGALDIAMGTLLAGALAKAGEAFVNLGSSLFSVSDQIKDTAGNISSQLGAGAERSAQLAQIAADVWGNNFAGSITEAGEAVVTISKNMEELPLESLQTITEQAFGLADAFGIDVQESTESAGVLMNKFGLTGQEAMDLITSGLQDGLNKNDDFLDSISEYSNLFAEAGFSAEEMYSIMATGAEGGVLGTDKIADAVKEMNIRLLDGGTAVEEAFDTIDMSFTDIAKSVAEGDTTWADYFDEIVTGLSDIENPIERNKAQVAIFGTMAEDLGVSFTDSLSTAFITMEDMAGAGETLNAQYASVGDAVEGFKRQALLAFEPISSAILEIVNNNMPSFQTTLQSVSETIAQFITDFQAGATPLNTVVDSLSQAFTVFTNGLKWIMENGNTILPIVTALGAGFATFKVLTTIPTAVTAVTAAWGALSAAFAASSGVISLVGGVLGGPLTIAIGLIAAAVAGLYWAWQTNFLGIQEVVASVMPQIQEFVTSVMGIIQSVVSVALAAVTQFWNEHKSSIMTIVNAVVGFVVSRFEFWKSTITTVISNLVTVGTAFWNTFGESIQSIVKTALGVVLILWNNLKIKLGATIDAIAALIEGDWRGFGEALRTITNAIISDISTIFWGAVSIFSTAQQAIITAVIDVWNNTDWAAIGQAVIDGIGNAIANGATAVANAAKAVAQAAWDAATGFLDTGSPSKLFYKLGNWVIEGFANALNDGQSTINDTVKNVFDFTGKLGGLASSAAQIFKNQTIDPILDEIAFLESKEKNIAESARNVLGIDTDQESLKRLFLTGTEEEKRQAQALLEIRREIALKKREEQEAQERILALQEKQQRLGFLKSQLDLLSFIQEQGLDPSILAGVQLGADADAGAILDATASAFEAVVGTLSGALNPAGNVNSGGNNTTNNTTNSILMNNMFSDDAPETAASGIERVLAGL